MINSSIEHRYTNRSSLFLVAHSSRKMLDRSLQSEFALTQVEISSYLLISLCFKEYCRSISHSIDLLDLAAFEIVASYYNRLVDEHSDSQLLVFSGAEIQAILERIGERIRSILFSTQEQDVELNCQFDR